MESSARYSVTKRATLLGAVINILLAVIKIVFGFLGHSHALIADGIHSLSDLASDAIVLLGSRIGNKNPDMDHPYGHARVETAATVVVSLILMIAGGSIIYHAWETLPLTALQTPNLYALFAAVIALLINEAVYHYLLSVAKRTSSQLMLAHAWHRRSDSFVSLVVLLGMTASYWGWHHFDSIAALIVGMLIIKIGIQLAWSNMRELVDTGLDPDSIRMIRHEILSVPGVKAVHQLRTRSMGQSVFVDTHVLVNSYISVSEGHHLSEQVMMALIHANPAIKDVTVHVDPEDDEIAHPSIHLPLRPNVKTTLMSHWQSLPGNDQVELIALHYLDGKITADISLPLTITHTHDAQQLIHQYQAATSHLSDIAKVRVWFKT